MCNCLRRLRSIYKSILTREAPRLPPSGETLTVGASTARNQRIHTQKEQESHLSHLLCSITLCHQTIDALLIQFGGKSKSALLVAYCALRIAYRAVRCSECTSWCTRQRSIGIMTIHRHQFIKFPLSWLASLSEWRPLALATAMVELAGTRASNGGVDGRVGVLRTESARSLRLLPRSWSKKKKKTSSDYFCGKDWKDWVPEEKREREERGRKS